MRGNKILITDNPLGTPKAPPSIMDEIKTAVADPEWLRAVFSGLGRTEDDTPTDTEEKEADVACMAMKGIRDVKQ